MESESYRDELAAALQRIERLTGELALFAADPTHERVAVAEQRLARAWDRRRRALSTLPRVVIASFVSMGAYALTDPAMPTAVRVLGYSLAALGAASTVLTILVTLAVTRETPWVRKLEALERDVRLAKGDVGRNRLAPALEMATTWRT